MIHCRKCGRDKPDDEFAKTDITKDGKQGRCKECVAKYHKEYFQKRRKAGTAGKSAPKYKRIYDAVKKFNPDWEIPKQTGAGRPKFGSPTINGFRVCHRCLDNRPEEEFYLKITADVMVPKPTKTKYDHCISCRYLDKWERARAKGKPCKHEFMTYALLFEVIVGYRPCYNCKEWRHTSEYFPSTDKSGGGMQGWCKSCVDKKLNASYRKRVANGKQQAYARKYYEEHPDMVAKTNEYYNRRYKNDPTYRLIQNQRRRFSDTVAKIKGKRYRGSAVTMLGCNMAEFKAHMEALWWPGMTWQNYGKGPSKWVGDHIVPVDAFDVTTPEELAVAFSYLNYQPLWGSLNSRKSAAVGWDPWNKDADKIWIPPETMEILQQAPAVCREAMKTTKEEMVEQVIAQPWFDSVCKHAELAVKQVA